MIGNDVVDLQLAQSQSNWHRKGFLEKVFTPSEISLVTGAQDKHLLVWLLWSMKEAAYKASQRKFSLPRSLNFLALECELQELASKTARGKVKIAGGFYYCSSVFHRGMIHSIASDTDTPEISVTLKETTSEEIKMQLQKELSQSLGLSLDLLRIRKNASGVPYFIVEQLSQMPFSVSAHGRFAAYCFPNEAFRKAKFLVDAHF